MPVGPVTERVVVQCEHARKAFVTCSTWIAGSVALIHYDIFKNVSGTVNPQAFN